ncbi:Mitochondrial protein Pet127 [Geosmithia morbida]|uniref:Mitochondrial protein Pet127 n=1 Tax=Geosmithia morbida TaxID=1094350 RepID=A0A9P4YRT2_9HYPO|nr:Mitochondrial protein Pet127 [Geosmithia morbida]KAF4120538.1 Mitochondrial protein Pet127 [Geosmithia morbida]
MLRRGSVELTVLRRACLGRAIGLRPAVLCANQHRPKATRPSPSPQEALALRTYASKRKKSKQSKSGSASDAVQKPGSVEGPRGEGTPMTDLEYQQSLWEAHRLESALDMDETIQDPAAVPGFEKASGPEADESRATTERSLKTANASSASTDGDAPKKTRRAAARAPRKSRKTPIDVKTLNPKDIAFTPVEEEENAHQPVPALSYGLDRVLFNPGVYQIQDARSQVFNFDPYLTTIMPVDEFDFDALKAYITSSKDTKLREMSKKHGMKYCGSTSSMTSILAHFHYLLSAWRKPNFSSLSQSLELDSTNFTRLTRAPASAYARLNDGVYAIDADKEFDKENILSTLGKSMEKLLTLPREEFEKYRRTRSHLITEEERNADEAYHYTTLGDFLMRSQLDARDARLPGTGIFDLKTRAVVSIRMDVQEYEKGRGYEIRKRFGQWESFEREYYDLIRAAFLKYSLQVRMGRMDGIFLAYHNTQRIFGFQYVSLEEMDHAIHGTSDRRLGDLEFKASVALLNDLLDRATKRFPGRSLRFHVETRDTKVPLTYFFAEPVTEEDFEQSREEAKRSVEAVQKDIMDMRDEQRAAEKISGQGDLPEQIGEAADESGPGTSAPGKTAEAEQSDEDGWEEMIAMMESIAEEVSDETKPEVADQTPVEKEKEGEPESTEAATASAEGSATAQGKPPREILGMYVTVRNKVNGELVDRPEDSPRDWSVQYAINEISESEAQRIYPSLRARRSRILRNDKTTVPDKWRDSYRDRLKDMAKQGERYRQKVERMQEGKVVYVAWDEKPLPPRARIEGVDRGEGA